MLHLLELRLISHCCDTCVNGDYFFEIHSLTLSFDVVIAPFSHLLAANELVVCHLETFLHIVMLLYLWYKLDAATTTRIQILSDRKNRWLNFKVQVILNVHSTCIFRLPLLLNTR